MTSVQQIIDSIGGTSAIAKALDLGASTVSEWKRSGSIPVRYFPRLIAAAEARGITGVTYETLVLAHQRNTPPASAVGAPGGRGSLAPGAAIPAAE